MPTITSNMGLKIPSVSETDYSTSVSDSFTSLDAHDHSSGKGTQIITGGITDLAVTTAKINDLAVTTGKLAANAVTTAKITDLNVTRAKLVAVGQIFSSDVSYNGNATSYTDITNATLSITTTGRPVVLMFAPVSTGVGTINIEYNTNTIGVIDVKAIRDVTDIAIFTLGTALNITLGSGGPSTTLPASSIFLLDVPAAGTYTYKLQVRKSGGLAGTAFAYTFTGRLLAYEL